MKKSYLILLLVAVISVSFVLGDAVTALAQESTDEEELQIDEAIAGNQILREKRDLKTRISDLEKRIAALERWKRDHETKYLRLRDSVQRALRNSRR